MTRSQAHRHTVRIPLWWVQLTGMVLSAAITVAVLWFALSLLFSFAQYIPSLP